jgi:hypothetical protein
MLQVVATRVPTLITATVALIVAVPSVARALIGKSSRQQGDAKDERRHNCGREVHFQDWKDAR